MAAKTRSSLKNILHWMVAGLILSVTTRIVAGYVWYFPPDFSVDFLNGRQDYFLKHYQWAFYPHLVAGPISLVLGLLLMSETWRRKLPRWHAIIGRIQVITVLFVLTPSGFWMGRYAQGNTWAKSGFLVLAILTGACAWNGWRTAVQRKFRAHKLWMTRCYIVLCSAVVTRILGGAFVVTGVYGEWTHTLAAWGTWLVPLLVFETSQVCTRNSRLRSASIVGVNR